MTKVIKNARLTPNVTMGTNAQDNNQTITSLLLKSKCGDCFCQIIIESNNREKSNESLSTNEKIKSLREEIYTLSGIPIALLQNLIKHLKKRLAKEEKLKSLKENETKEVKTLPGLEERKEVFARTIFIGKKSDFAKNAANYYFNEKNIFGLHLSHKQLDHIADMLCDNFIAEDGTLLSWRSVHDILKLGFKMNEKGEYIS